MNVTTLFLVILGSLRTTFAVTGGRRVEAGEYPYVVSIRDPNNCHVCAGTIIADQWVLTSNICYSRSWWGTIKYGTTNLDNCGEKDNNQIKIDNVLYNPWASDLPPYTHDLVLIHLNSSIPFSDDVKPVELPILDETWPYNQNATILGWGGATYFARQDQLQAAEIPLYTDEYCIQSSLWHGWTPDDPFVMKCGGEVNKTYSCFYDYGGPLIYAGKQFGVVSYLYPGFDGYCGYYLGIYSPISYFRNWIRNITGI